MESCARENDLDGIVQTDLAFHRTICAASGNGVIITLWETLARHMRIAFKLELLEDPGPPREIPDHHRRLREALAGADVGIVEREIEVHIMRLHRSRRETAA